MHRTSRALVTGLLAVAIAAPLLLICRSGVAQGHPVPAAIAYRWQLIFIPGDLRLFVADDDTAFWYFTYKLVNRTGDDRMWAPDFTLFTDRGEIIEAGNDVPSNVESEILELMNNEYLERQSEIIGEIHPGVEHAREGLVIWRPGDLSANEISMFIGGISGETARVTNPVTGEEVIMRKTLHREYLVPGNAVARGSDPVELAEETWVMR